MWLPLALKIWKHRNRNIFYNGQLDEVDIFARAQWQTWSWVKFGRQRIRYYFPKWCMNLSVCLAKIR